MAFVVIARWRAMEGEVENVEAAIRKLAPLARGEEAMISYTCHRDPEDDRLFVFYEQYTDEKGYEAHVESEHFRELGFGTAIPLLESREREFYTTFDV